MRTKTTKIDDRLDIYGPSTCPICGNRRETIFGGNQLVCRRHPGHPLFREPGKHEAEAVAPASLELAGISTPSPA